MLRTACRYLAIYHVLSEGAPMPQDRQHRHLARCGGAGTDGGAAPLSTAEPKPAAHNDPALQERERYHRVTSHAIRPL